MSRALRSTRCVRLVVARVAPDDHELASPHEVAERLIVVGSRDAQAHAAALGLGQGAGDERAHRSSPGRRASRAGCPGGRTGALLRSDAAALPPCAPRGGAFGFRLGPRARGRGACGGRRAATRPGSRARPARHPLPRRAALASAAVRDPAHGGRAGRVAHVRDRARAVARRRVALRLERGVDLAQRVRMHAELGGAVADRGQRRALGIAPASIASRSLATSCAAGASAPSASKATPASVKVTRAGMRHMIVVPRTDAGSGDHLESASARCGMPGLRRRAGGEPGGARRHPGGGGARGVGASSSRLPAQSCIRTPARSASRTTARTSCARRCASARSVAITSRSERRSASSSWPIPEASARRRGPPLGRSARIHRSAALHRAPQRGRGRNGAGRRA